MLNIKNKIPQRSIFSMLYKNKLKKRELLKYKFLKDQFINPTTTIIYGQNCLFIQWSYEPLTIKISNSEIVESQKNYFNQLWDKAN